MITRNKSVLLLASSYLPNIGGVENSIRHLAEEYQTKGYHVDIVSSVSHVSSEDVAGYDNAQAFNIYRYNSSSFIMGYLSSYRLLKRLRRQRQYDLVIVRSHMLVVVARLSGFKKLSYVIPGVVRFQENSNNAKVSNIKASLRYSFNCFIQKLAFRFSHKLYIFSENMQSQVWEVMPGSEVINVSPGVSLERFHEVSDAYKQELRFKHNIRSHGLVALCVGRLVKAKGFDLAIEAIKYFEKDITLIIVGTGQELDNLRAKVSRLGLKENVIFKGKQAMPEDFYKLADVFILSSRYEPFGQVLLEASACSLPVVALRNEPRVMTATSQIYSDHPELVFFAEENTAVGIADGVKAALKKPKDDLCSSFESFRAKYSWKSLANSLENGD